jgi:hypothetical protein
MTISDKTRAAHWKTVEGFKAMTDDELRDAFDKQLDKRSRAEREIWLMKVELMTRESRTHRAAITVEA